MRGTFAALAVGLGLIGSSEAAAAERLWEFAVSPPTNVQPLPMSARPRSVSLVRVFVDMPEGERWASYGLQISINRGYLDWEGGRTDVDVKDLAPEFAQVVSAAGFAAPAKRDLFEGQTSSDLQVGAVISKIGGQFCFGCGITVPNDHGRGAATMSIEWQIYSPLERRVLATAKTQAAYETRENRLGVSHILNGAFRENVRLLLNTPEFRGVVLGGPTAGGPAPSLEPIRLNTLASRPRPIPDTVKSVVSVFASTGMGSGFLVSADGYLMTNQHVVGESKYVKVKWADGAETVGEVLRVDRARDVALIKTDPAGRRPLALRPNKVTLGEPVFAIGTPLDAKFQGSVTKGIVSATRTYDGLSYIQSDVVINNGNSGGPLIDGNGSVIGITVAGMEISGAPVGINLFIPIDDALKALALRPAT